MLNGTLAATKLLIYNTTKLKTAVETVAKTVGSLTTEGVLIPEVIISDENILNVNGNNNIEGSMRVWRFFSTEERMLLAESFKKVINKSDFGSELILGVLEDNYELFNILIGKPEGRIYIESPEQLRKDFPKATKIGDGIQRFLGEVISDLNDDLVSSGVIIKKCRVLGAKHKRYRINFQAESWLSVKRVIVNTILNNYFRKSTPFSNKFIQSASNYFWNSKLSHQQEKMALIWQKLVEVVVKNMKAGFLDSASYGPEFVENEELPDTDTHVMLR